MRGSYRDFWEMPFDELCNAIEGYLDAELVKWKRLRRASFMQLAGLVDVRKNGIKETSLYRLPGDDEEEKSKVTMEEKAAMFERVQKRDADWLEKMNNG
jgi:hypothetical protein